MRYVFYPCRSTCRLLLFLFIELLKFYGDQFLLQTVFENSLMQHHIALPPDAMGKITYVAPPGQYSLKVCVLN